MNASNKSKCPYCEKPFEDMSLEDHIRNSEPCSAKLKNAMRVAMDLDREEGEYVRARGGSGRRYNYLTGGYDGDD